MVLAAPHNIRNMDYIDLAPFKDQVSATGNKMIIFDPAELAFGAFDENGKLVH